MSISKAIESLNVPLIVIVTLLAFSVSTISAMWLASPAAANKRPGPPYSTPMSMRDDGCYSTLGTGSNVSTLLGGPSFGLVNAIVNAPVYDWDQVPENDFTIRSHTPYSGLRGNLGGDVVGYAYDFDFKVTPVPNLLWMTQYFTKQLPYDIGQLSLLAGGTNPLANSGIGDSRANSFVANPFIYQQGAIIFPNGTPRVQAITGPLTNPQGSGNWLSSLNPGTLLTNLQGVLGAGDDLLSQNSGVIDDVKNGDIKQIVGNINTSSAGLAGSAANLLINSPLLAPATVKYNVNGDYNQNNSARNDMCYESLSGTKKVPSYAFSVLDTAIPITIPGWLYTPITMIDGRGFSASGMTLYPPGSINDKDLLDCYGRGTTSIVTGSGRFKMGDFAVLPYAGASAMFGLPIIGQINAVLHGVGPGTIIVNTVIAAAITAAGVAADAAAPGSGSAVAGAAFRLPAMETAYETYTSGFAFGFLIEPNGVKRLPTHLANRVIDYNNSGTFSINGTYLIGSDGTSHTQTQNGKQFNPDLYVKLKKPYELAPQFTIAGDSDPGARRDKLDGTTVEVKINNQKSGFDTGKTTAPRDATNVYRPSTTDGGGPTYDDNAGGTNRSFTRASVYRIIMKPGVIPNAIDVDKRVVGTKAAYTGSQLAGATDSCAFLRQKLADGDTDPASQTRASVSQVTNSNANNGRPEFAPADAVQCDYAKRADGTPVRDVEIRMGSGAKLQELYNIAEKIPAEVEPGTKYCYAVYYDSYGNDVKFQGSEWWGNRNSAARQGAVNYNPNYNAEQDKRYLSKAKCIISGYKPSMQVRGGDLIVNGGVFTGTNTKDFLASTSDPKELRRYGSWVEYGVIASGAVVNLGSGASYRTGMPVPLLEEFGSLTFTNKRNSSNKADYGRYADDVNTGFGQVARQFTAMSGQARADVVGKDTVDLATEIPESGVYKLKPNNATVTITASSVLPANRSIILLAEAGTTINVASNIEIPTAYGSIGEISQVVIAPATETSAYTINVDHNVGRLDSWLVNPNGLINTCRTAQPNGSIENTPRSRGLCDNTLTVNGPVAAKELLLRRNGGKDQGDETTVRQSEPAENFNLRPDAYIWAANYVDGASKKYITTNSVDLPPRY